MDKTINKDINLIAYVDLYAHRTKEKQREKGRAVVSSIDGTNANANEKRNRENHTMYLSQK